MAHNLSGTVPLLASPINLSATPVSYQRPPPMLGEHTEEVLSEILELNSADFENLKTMGVI